MAKNLLLAAVSLVVFFALVEGTLAALGFRPILYSEDPFVGFESRIPLFVERLDGDERVMETAPNKLGIFNLQRFPVEKPAGTTRIFCLGGSTTYGRPYDDRTSFCGWLRVLLPVADPSRRWDVINAGGISYASYRVAALMEELVGYAPDLFVIYTGHNEFLEQRTYGEWLDTPVALRHTSALLSATRTYSALSRVIGSLRGADRAGVSQRDVLPGEVEALLDRSVGPADYRRDDALRRRVANHFRLNLARMVQIGRSAGAEVILVNPASNLGHCAPFKSEPEVALDPAERRRLDASLAAAEEALRGGDSATALLLAEGVLKREPRHAGARYLRGQALRASGRVEESHAELARARDEDVCPLRAPSEILAGVAAVAAEQDVPWVDYAAAMAARAADGIPGEDLFLDHVHPTIEAHRLLALALIDELIELGEATPGAQWNDAAVAAVAREVEAGIGHEDSSRALANLGRVLAWAGKLEEAHGLALRALELTPDHPDGLLVAGVTAQLTGRNPEAVRHYQAALGNADFQARDHITFASALEQTGELARAGIQYREGLRIEPGNVRARLGLARVLSAQGHYDEAAELLGAVIAESPEHGPAQLQLGIALAGRGDHRDALRHFEKVLGARPNFAGVHRRMAASLRALGRDVEATAHDDRALELESR